MPDVLDPLTRATDLLIEYLKSEPLLAAFNWQPWDSDEEVVQPRGYVNAASEAALLYGSGPEMLHMEIVLEGKPKRDNLAPVMGAVLAMVNDEGLHNSLNALVADQSMVFYQRAEQVQARQAISGDLRVRTVGFLIAAQWFGEFT